MDATREARWQELRMQVEGLLPQGQLLTAEQIAEKFRIITGKGPDLLARMVGFTSFEHAIQQIECIDHKLDGSRVCYFKKQQAAMGNGIENGGAVTDNRVGVSTETQNQPTSYQRVEKEHQATSALYAAASISANSQSQWKAFGSQGFGVRPAPAQQLVKKPPPVIENNRAAESSRPAVAPPQQSQRPQQTRQFERDSIWKEESDGEDRLDNNHRSRAPPSPVGHSNNTAAGSASSAQRECNGASAVQQPPKSSFGNDIWELGSDVPETRYTERGEGQFTDNEVEVDDDRDSDYGSNPLNTRNSRLPPRQTSNPPPLRGSPPIAGANSLSPFKLLQPSGAQRMVMGRPNSMLPPPAESLGGSSAFRSISTADSRLQSSGAAQPSQQLRNPSTTMAPPLVANTIRTAHGNVPAFTGMVRTVQDPRPAKFASTTGMAAQQSTLPSSMSLSGMGQATVPVSTNTAIRRLVDNGYGGSGGDYGGVGISQSRASSVSNRTNASNATTDRIVDFENDDGQSEASTVRQEERFQPGTKFSLPSEWDEISSRNDYRIVNGGGNSKESDSDANGSPQQYQCSSAQLGNVSNGGNALVGQPSASHSSQKLPIEEQLSRLAEMLSGMAKFVWPEHLRLDDALAGVEKISRQFVDPENVLRGFEYGDFIIRNCPSLRVTSANDTYVLQWIEKPTLMLLANPPDSHHDFANASIQCLRYIPEIFRYLRRPSSSSGDAVLDEVTRIVKSSAYSGNSVSHLRALPELGNGRFARGQCDAAEFLVDELLYNHAPPEWRKLFTYIYRDKIECRNCRDKRYDHTQEARSVDITLVDGEQKFTDRLDLLNMRVHVDNYNCTKCRSQMGNKRREYRVPPSMKYLLLNLKPSENSFRLIDPQSIPQIRGHRENRQEMFKFHWRAIASIVHDGTSPDNGHYYAMGRWEGESEWQVMDDDKEPRKHASLNPRLQGHYIVIYERLD